MNDNNNFDKLYFVFVTVLAGLMLFSSGGDANQHHYQQMTLGLVIALFFIGIGALTVWSRFKSLQDKVEAERRDADYLRNKIADQGRADAMKAAAVATEQAINTAGHQAEGIGMGIALPKELIQDMEVVKSIFEDLGFGDRPPRTPEEFTRVEQAFHDHTDHYVKLEVAPDGGVTAAFSLEAPEVEAAKELAAKATKTKANGNAMDSVKKLTPAQQRKANLAKGLGSFTDAEVKEQRNAKRREARAAKKAAAETTTDSTTLPGQTNLV